MKIGTIIIGYVCMYLASIRLAKANSATTVRDYRLELHNNQVSHNEAKTDCESRGAWLVEIKDKEIDDAVKTLVSTGDIWIGLSYGEAWRWSDGSPIHYEYWRDDADINLNKNKNHVCVRRGSSDWWLNVNCNSNLRYICQSDTTYLGSFNLKVKDQQMNFHEAKANCQTDGATLIDIKATELNTFAVQTVSDKIGKYWTGGNSIGHTGTYRWGDGTVISDDNPGWYKGDWREPNNKHLSNYCVAIQIASDWKGWVDVNCSSQASPICQKNVTCDNSICSNHGSCEIVGTRYKCSCDSGYFGTKCENDLVVLTTSTAVITVQPGEVPVLRMKVTSYESKVTISRSIGSTTIDDKTVNIDKIGIIQSVEYSTGVMTQTTTFTFTAVGGQTSSSIDIQVQVTDLCSSNPCKNGGACSRTNVEPYFSCDCKRAFEGINCANRIFFASGNCKYHVNNDQKLKFPNANNTCQALHGSLVMIKSLSLQDQLEVQIIKQYDNKGGNIEFWLGGYRSNGTWLWMDGTKIPSTGPNQNWVQNRRQYMILSSYGTTWNKMRWWSKNDDREGGSRGFICEVADDDPCEAVLCGSHGACVSTGCQANCRCNPGYFGNVCQNESLKIVADRDTYTALQGQNVTVKIYVESNDGAVAIKMLNNSYTYRNVKNSVNITIGPLLKQTKGDIYLLRASPESVESPYFKHLDITIRVEGPPTVNLSVTEVVLPVEDDSNIVVCEATGVPKPYATWIKDGKKVSSSSNSSVYQQEMKYSSQLLFSRAAREVGIYTCLVQNTVLGQRRRANASIFVRGKPITLNKSYEGLDRSSGTSSFVCSFEAYPVAVIEWRSNNGTHNKTIKPNINGSIFKFSTVEIKSNNWTRNMSKLSIKLPEYLGRTVISCCSSNGNENLCETFSHFNTAIAILGSVTYRIYGREEEKNYSGAQMYCNSNNAKLVKIPNARTQEELTTHLAGFTRSVFAGGLRSFEDEFIWKWSDGSSFYNETGRDTTKSGSYTSWSDGEPNEPENSCLALNKTKSWNWTDANCSATIGFICERNVSGIPDHFLVDVENCTSNITVTWIAGLGAIGVEHSTEFRGHHSKTMSAEETHSIIPSDQTAITQRSSGLQFDETYNITITVCPDCPHPYSITKRATTYTMLPASNATVTRADVSLQNDSCIISWLANTRGIIGYMIATSSKLSRVSSSKYSQLNFTNDTLLGNQNEHVQISEPNRIYSFTVQAQSCLGFGIPVKINESCITEVAAPASLPIPTVDPTMNSDGTKTIHLNVVDEINGPISCMFVLVTYEPDSTKNGSVMYDLARLQKASEKAKSDILDSTESYLALAIKQSEISSFTESGERITRTLGDETQTECYVGTDPNTNRRKRSTSSSAQVVGRNRKLEDRASYSIFTVTTTPGSEEVFFQTSPQQFVEAEGVSLLSGGEIAGIVIGVLLMIVLAVVTLLYISKRKTDAKMQGTEALNMQDIQDDQENIYMNVGVENQQPGSETNISLDKLQETYMMLQANGFEKFQEQFQKLKVEAKKIHYPTEVASNLELKNKNRYKNILPADTSRVILSGSGLESYINACYVNGFRSLKKFIATQGPLKTTVADFWKMVFEQKSTVIVMLTKCKEKSKVKCEKYWPDVGMEKMFGAITVKNSHEKLHSSYVERNFEVSDATSAARVRQFHFLEWPDHGVPTTTTNIIGFCDAVSEMKTDKPIIVHCSAGAGRTGAYIGFNILSEEQESLRYIDIYQCVMNMRNQRVDMVQTKDQYVLLHKLLLEKHLFGITEINVDEVSAVLSSEITLRKEFGNLSIVGPINQTKFGNMPKHQLFNRNADIIPYESNRVTIVMKSYETESPYINASTIESYESDIRLIAAQGPMKDTVQYFWRAILDNDVNTVIMLTRCNEGKKNQCVCYWPENEARNTTMDGITVNFQSVRIYGEVIAREFQVIRDGAEKTIRQFHYQAWNSNENPNSISDILELADRMRESVRKSHGGRALIHCSDGAGRTGVFCAIVNLIAQVQDGNKVDVFRAVKDLRDCRPGMVQTLDQYKMCYEAVKVYLTSFHVYSNFGVGVREEMQENLYANL